MCSRSSVLVLVFTLAFNLTPAAPHAADGTIFTVDSTADEPNATLGSPVCSSTPSHVCTLRAAIMAANANPGPDTIVIPADLFHLTVAGADDTAQAGDLDITGDLTIVGAGAGLTIIDGSLLSGGDRLFDLRPSATVTMTGLTIQNGLTNDRGGAIRIGDSLTGGATLRISNCSILNNQTAVTKSGGAFFNAHASSVLVITNCTIAGNASSYGGAVHNNGSLTVTNSTIYSNAADSLGGGILNQAGTALISGSTFSSNASAAGGAIYNNAGSALTFASGTITNNTSGEGGGIANFATLTIRQSGVYSNATASTGGGLYNHGSGVLLLISTAVSSNTANYGGGIYNGGVLTVTDGLLSQNTSAYDGAGLEQNGITAVVRDSAIVDNAGNFGGGIMITNGAITLTNSTISGNTTFGDGGGIYNHAATGRVSLANVTIAFNRAGYAKAGGGLDNDAGGSLDLKNSLIAWNAILGNHGPVYISDCGGAVTSGGYNLMRVKCGFTPQASDQVGTLLSPLDPQIGPLLNNGGATLTHALLAGSLAIDSGNPGGCDDQFGSTLQTDQRGAPRPANGAGSTRCDIGAYELQRTLDLPLVLK